MSKKETSLYGLEHFIPAGAFELVAPFFKTHTIYLSLTHERKTILGDYRCPTKEHPYHRISVNVNLNRYSLLITLLHELAHLQSFVHYQHSIAPHGKEWKTVFRHILVPFIGKGFFPRDIEKALVAYLHNPAASTCTDPALFKALYKYDKHEEGFLLIDDLQIGHWFTTDDGRIFEKIEQLRTRAKCKDLQSRKVYLFPGIYEVKQVRRDKRKIA
jgi:hypothetical protein